MKSKDQKRALRHQLYVWMAKDDAWHKSPDSLLYKQITEVKRELWLTPTRYKKRRD